MVTKFRDNRLRIDWLYIEKLTFILDYPSPVGHMWYLIDKINNNVRPTEQPKIFHNFISFMHYVTILLTIL